MSQIPEETWKRLRAQVDAKQPKAPETELTKRQAESRALKEKSGWDYRELRCTVAGLETCTPDERRLMYQHWFGFVMAEYWIPRWRRAEADRLLTPVFGRGERANGAAVVRCLAKHFDEPVISRDVYLMHRPFPFGMLDQ